MQSLIIPLAILLLVAMWGFYETGRKFRKEFRRRGKAWECVCLEMTGGQGGVLVVDMLWGPQRGLGHPVVWWLPVVEDMALQIESGGAWLVRCPRRWRNVAALRERFGPEQVRVHGWAVAEELLSADEAG